MKTTAYASCSRMRKGIAIALASTFLTALPLVSYAKGKDPKWLKEFKQQECEKIKDAGFKFNEKTEICEHIKDEAASDWVQARNWATAIISLEEGRHRNRKKEVDMEKICIPVTGDYWNSLGQDSLRGVLLFFHFNGIISTNESKDGFGNVQQPSWEEMLKRLENVMLASGYRVYKCEKEPDKTVSLATVHEIERFINDKIAREKIPTVEQAPTETEKRRIEYTGTYAEYIPCAERKATCAKRRIWARPDIKETSERFGYVLYRPPYYLLPQDFGRIPFLSASAEFGRMLTGRVDAETGEFRFSGSVPNVGAGMGCIFSTSSRRSWQETTRIARDTTEGGLFIELNPFRPTLGFDGFVARILITTGIMDRYYVDKLRYADEPKNTVHSTGTNTNSTNISGEIEFKLDHFALGAYAPSDLRKGIGGLAHIYFNNWAGPVELLGEINMHQVELGNRLGGTRMVNAVNTSAELQFPVYWPFALDGIYLYDSLAEKFGETPHGYAGGIAILGGWLRSAVRYIDDPILGPSMFFSITLTAASKENDAFFIDWDTNGVGHYSVQFRSAIDNGGLAH